METGQPTWLGSDDALIFGISYRPGSSNGKESVTRETQVQSLGQEDPLEKRTATHFSVLAWRIPRTEEPGRLQAVELERVRQD